MAAETTYASLRKNLAAVLDRVVDGATIVKLKGKSYRVHRGGEEPTDQ